jgi:polyhydroxyalkanoate synthesis regulator phasin
MMDIVEKIKEFTLDGDGYNSEYNLMLLGAIDEIESLRQQLAEQTSALLELVPNDEAKKFWQDTYSDGVSAQDIANELSDMHIMLEAVPIVYQEVTGGMLSKHTYKAKDVISEYRNHVDKLVNELVKDELEASESQSVEVLLEALRKLAKYPSTPKDEMSAVSMRKLASEALSSYKPTEG